MFGGLEPLTTKMKLLFPENILGIKNYTFKYKMFITRTFMTVIINGHFETSENVENYYYYYYYYYYYCYYYNAQLANLHKV